MAYHGVMAQSGVASISKHRQSLSMASSKATTALSRQAHGGNNAKPILA